MSRKGLFFTFFTVILSILAVSAEAYAQGLTLPNVNLGFKSTKDPSEIVSTIKIIMILTVLTLAPAILIMMTSFTRIIIVLSVVRQALGTQQMPPNQLMVGLALFITLFIMSPFLQKINTEAVQPYLAGTIKQDVALDKALSPLRKFMFNQTRDDDLALFIKMSRMDKVKTRADVPTTVLVPAFIISELKTAFADDNGSSVIPAKPKPEFFTHLPMFLIDVICPTTT